MAEKGVPRALELAREARRQPTEQEALAFAGPNRLHVAAQGDHELYRHAMIEAGLIVDDRHEKFDPCPVCGWSRKAEEA